MNTQTFAIEVVTLPVRDVERSIRFYRDQLGFTLDEDVAPSAECRFVQLTPPGSSCSIHVGIGITDAPAGSVRGLYLVVTDLEATRNHLRERSTRGRGQSEHLSCPTIRALDPRGDGECAGP